MHLSFKYYFSKEWDRPVARKVSFFAKYPKNISTLTKVYISLNSKGTNVF